MVQCVGLMVRPRVLSVCDNYVTAVPSIFLHGVCLWHDQWRRWWMKRERKTRRKKKRVHRKSSAHHPLCVFFSRLWHSTDTDTGRAVKATGVMSTRPSTDPFQIHFCMTQKNRQDSESLDDALLQAGMTRASRAFTYIHELRNTEQDVP